MPSCIRPEVSLPLGQHVLCSDCIKKIYCLAQVVFSYFVLHSSKIPLVIATAKVTHLRSLLFRQPDGVNCVVRSLFWVGVDIPYVPF